MFGRFSAFFLFATLFATLAFAGSVLQAREDYRLEVEIPKKDTLKELTKAWKKECEDLANPHAAYLVEKGYAGPNTASVYCLKNKKNGKTVQFTEQVIKKLHLKPAPNA